MSVPFSLQSDGYPKTLAAMRNALEKRIRNDTLRLGYTAAYHRGTPDPAALPDEKLGIWLDWDHIGRDDQEPYEATMLVTDWHVYIVAQDEGNDNFGADSPLGEKVWGGILKTLTETNVDIGLDGTVDYVPTPETNHFRGNIAGGNRRVEVIEMLIAAHWAMELCRHPE